MHERRLTRSETNKVIAGVSGGLADYLDIDPVLVRLAFLALFFASGIGAVVYVALAVIAPTESEAKFEKSPDDIDHSYPRDGHRDGVRQRNTSMLFAALMIIGGIYFLFDNMGVQLEFLWPLLLIAFGVMLIMSRNK